ncbi:response regulator [Salarchaeum sp. III]|uniref:response regulator n=1 Tax=Salarchaeum sp. III TaxID=3107927 RepID=UPI002ED80506
MDSAGDDTTQYRVLVVDDDEEVAATISLYLEDDTNLETVIETSAADALDRLDDEDIHCVISDYRMPRATGIDLLEDIREDYPALPFLLFTARGSELVASKAISAGATDYLPKGSPEKYDLLANRTRNAIEQAEARAELERAKARFDALVKNTEYTVITIDEASRIEYVNDAVEELLGYAPEDLDGEHLDTIIPDHPAADHETAVENSLEAGEKHVDWNGTEFSAVHADGTELTVEIAFDEYETGSAGHLFTGVMRRADD